MIPYTTCMRFNTRMRLVNEDDNSSISEWTVVPHFEMAHGLRPTLMRINSQDDQNLCITWTIDPHFSFESKRESLSSFASDHQESEGFDDKSPFVLSNMLRRRSMQLSNPSEMVTLLDQCYYGISERYLRQSYQWNFNTFTLDIMTGGHSLPSLLLFLFKEYGLVETFHLDQLNVMRCLRYLENGYHDTNPYHNSIHAADVTQAMHCFLQEASILPHLSPMEIMCALLAAVAHDLDHPGVNQNFLVATKSHLAALYNNLSVLESHHWRFALSCFHESHIFDHFTKQQWQEVEHLLKHLILATDISRQNEFIKQFRAYNRDNPNGLDLVANSEHRHFVLQIALKCADLGNPCRPWSISKKWSEQICTEFYRQGDNERKLNLPITTICDRKTSTISKIQTEFFKNIVRPLFEVWHEFLESPLSRTLMTNLQFNECMWKRMEGNALGRKMTRCNSTESILPEPDSSVKLRRSKSNIGLSSLSLPSWDLKDDFKALLARLKEEKEKKSASVADPTTSKPKCINGCGTPPENMSSSDRSTDETTDIDEEADVLTDDCGAILSTPALFLPSYYRDKNYQAYSRRGSAPDCISSHKKDMTTKAKRSALRPGNVVAGAGGVVLGGGMANRRSSFPVFKVSNRAAKNSNSSLPATVPINVQQHQHQHQHLHRQGSRGQSLDLTSYHMMGAGKHFAHHFGSKYRKTNESFYHSSDHHQEQPSLFQDVAVPRNLGFPPFLINLDKDRRRSVPQDIFIRSLDNYTA